ncbi:Protein of unknown function [Marinobacter persicus]|uniref:DUF3530 family protein n=1 Tax=Marinobacter persicus TaxID=930118 RepID=A0A1I3QUD9_9GAMM|nr:DUF3530 family protein [Marinobacter persicus]SFJ37109.1 Protein of unknown function [Marinobacter persicus]
MALIGKRKSSWLVFGLLWIWSCGALAQEQGAEQAPADEQANEEKQASAQTKDRPVLHSGLGEWGLARQYPEQAVWLDLEDDSRALALFSPELETPARAAVIVLADEGQTADQGVTGALRRTLPEAGMATMTLGLRAPPEDLRRSRLARDVPRPGNEEDSETGNAETGNPANRDGSSVMIDVASDEELEKIFDNYARNVRSLLDAAFSELEERGYQTFLVVSVGWSADYVAEWAAGRDQLEGAVWLAPAFSPARLEAMAELLAAERNWWLLDLHGSGADTGRQGRERGARFKREGVSNYRRQALPLASPPRREDAAGVVSRLRGQF